MLIHDKMENSTVNGPGNRAVIWVQGCLLGCPGCFNPETHETGATNIGEVQHKWLEETKIITWLRDAAKKHNLEGMTWSGGEPMHQVDKLIQVCRYLGPNFSIGMFTGYNLFELENGRYDINHFSTWYGGPGDIRVSKVLTGTDTPEQKKELWNELKCLLDFAVMGRYVKTLPSNRAMCGSSNQSIELFGDRYKLDDFKRQQAEITIDEEGLVQITGFPDPGMELAREI